MSLAPITNDDHILGPKSAPITLVEYGDYQCPTCIKSYALIEKVLTNFGPRLRFVFRHFAMAKAHPLAEMAAQSAEFAAEHGLFWQMHHLLYTNAKELTLDKILQLAEQIKLPKEPLKEALAQKKSLDKIRASFLQGIKGGVNASPTFFINGIRYNGSLAALGPYMDAILEEKKEQDEQSS